MEAASPVVSPFRLGVSHELMRKHFQSMEPSEAWMPPTPEPNFRIDDLLDFSNGELCGDFVDEEQEDLKEGSLSRDKVDIDLKVRCTAQEESQQQPTTSGLCVPSDELIDQLEWLSAFHEDSSYSGDRALASLVSSGGLKNNDEPALHLDNKFQSSSPNSVLELNSIFCGGFFPRLSSTSCSFGQHVPSRARSKRGRSGSRIWSFDSIMPTLFDTRLAGSAAQESPIFFGSLEEPQETPVRPSKMKRSSTLFKCIDEAPIRRCSHCLVTKTPQWRAGPMGPKTLCNACGVRYKSGRLVPEYRPAGSPTFVSEVHSNSHKRILEMRRIKEMEEHTELLRDEEEGGSDCVSQGDSCKELRRMKASPLDDCSQENLNGLTCSGKDDATGPVCSEMEDPAVSICIENGSAKMA